MEINLYDENVAKVAALIAERIKTLSENLAKGNMVEWEKDVVNTWYQRGQIAALDKLKTLLTIKE